ncbi:Exportin-5, C-terminal domain [Dillenia turbinata]|uniref:Exportin-5, C-terminal domain n=1 Tax=Dillenia turbinata TaxID=194707 RepID=A0AAN8UK11_9MAGN
MEDSNSIASNVARAIVAALDWSSSPDSRKAASAYLDSWDEFSSTDRQSFATVAVDLMSEIAKPCEEWALKSQAAALVAEIVRREGLDLWQLQLPSLVSLSNSGAFQAKVIVAWAYSILAKILLYYARKIPSDVSSSEFDSEMGIVFQILIKASGEFFHRSMPNNGAIEEKNLAVSSSSFGSGQAKHEKRKILSVVNEDIFAVILDTSFMRLVKREKVLAETSFSLGALELWRDDFVGKGEFSQYRSRLLELIRLVASEKPLIAAAKVSERNVAIIKDCMLAPMPPSMQLALENVIIAVFDGSNEFGSSSEMQLMLGGVIEVASLVEVDRTFASRTAWALFRCIGSLFKVLLAYEWHSDCYCSNEAYIGMQLTAFLFFAGSSNKQEERLLRSEHNLLGEAFLIMASAAGYNVLGLSVTIGDPFFKCLDSNAVVASLVENHALSGLWCSLLHEGRAKVPDDHVLALRGLNTGLPSLEQSGHIGRVEAASLKDLEAFASSSMIVLLTLSLCSFLLKHKMMALPVLEMNIEAFSWTDEAVTKISSSCGVVVLLAILSDSVDLQGFVSKELFCAII